MATILPVDRQAPISKFALALGLSTVLYKVVGYYLREKVFLPKLTILNDLPRLGTRRKDGKSSGHVVICGGSIAGLLAASVCAEHFENVLVIDSEDWTTQHGSEVPKEQAFRTTSDGYRSPVHVRTHVPQYSAFHFLLPTVELVLRRLYPKLRDELDHFGLVPSVMNLRFYYGGKYMGEPHDTVDPKSGAPTSFYITRESYETMLRHALRTNHPNVTICTGTVTGFTKDPDNPNRVQSIKLRTATADDGELDRGGDLFIDATGPAQFGFHHGLPGIGFGLPADIRQQYNPHMLYTTGVWTITPKVKAKWPVPWGFEQGCVFSFPADISTGENRQAYIGIMEKDQFQITAGGWDMRDRPHTTEGFHALIRDMRGSEDCPSWLWELLALIEENEDELNPWYADANVGALSWIRYHKSTSVPDNFVAVGDAVMKLNPIYGQGVTQASYDATTLDAVLRRIPANELVSATVSKPYFELAAARVEGMWEGTRANDYAFSTTVPAQGEDLEHGKFMRDFGRQVIYTAREDKDVLRTWWYVGMGLAPATDMFAPWFLWRVAKKWYFG